MPLSKEVSMQGMEAEHFGMAGPCAQLQVWHRGAEIMPI